MNHPHLKYLRDGGYGAVADVLEFNGDRDAKIAIPLTEWEGAFRFLGKLPRGSTLQPIVRHIAAWRDGK